MDTAEMISHLQEIDHPDFDATLYTRHGYILQGSVKSNGHLIQVSAFKLHELQAVRYRRLSPDRMPNPLTSTLGGTDKYLKEIRNAICSPYDVQSTFGCEPKDITVMALDLGTEGLVGATVLPPDGADAPRRRKKSRRRRRPDKKRRRRRGRKSSTKKHVDVVVKQRAVEQPTKRFQHWLNNQKEAIRIDSNSTFADVEASLPPLRGEGASVRFHVQARRQAEPVLDALYNQSNFVKHAWDA